MRSHYRSKSLHIKQNRAVTVSGGSTAPWVQIRDGRLQIPRNVSLAMRQHLGPALRNRRRPRRRDVDMFSRTGSVVLTVRTLLSVSGQLQMYDLSDVERRYS